jgi:hypothetical protein
MPSGRGVILRSIHHLALVAILGLVWSPQAAHAEPDVPLTELPAVLRTDERLARRVSISEERVYIGELLERLGREAGVRLEASERLAPVSGYEVTILVQDRPLREVLDALARLYHCPPDRWSWAREGRGDRVRYVLRHTLPPETWNQHHQSFAEEYMLDQHRRLAQLWAAPPEQREVMARDDPFLQAFNNARNAGFFSFVGDVPEETLRFVMRGGRFEIPMARLSPSQRDFISSEYGSRNRAGQEAMLQSVWLTGPADTASRSISLNLGEIGSHAVLGGIWLRDALREHARDSWAGTGEERRAPGGTVPVDEDIPPEQLRVQGEMHDTIVHRLARLGHLNVILDRRLQGSYSLDAMTPHLEGELSEVLARLEQADLTWKWRRPFLLFRPLGWQQFHRDALAPWPFVRDLRASAASNGGYLQPEDWLRLADLPLEQLLLLGEHYPDVHGIRQVQVLLRLIGAMNEREQALIARTEGAAWADLSRTTRQRLLVLFPTEDARLVRVHARWDREARPPRAYLYMGAGVPVPQPREFRFQRKEDLQRPSRAPGPGN